MDKEIVEGNKLIAEFDGKRFVSYEDNSTNAVFEGWVWDENGKQKQSNHLQYHTSWDWLMPVVEKIEQWARVDIYGKACKISQPQWTVDIAKINERKIVAVLEAVIQFIQWYNQNKQP